MSWRLELLAALALLAALGYGTGWVLAHERAQGRAEARAEYAEQLVSAQEAARRREQDLLHQRDAAILERDRHEQTIRQLALESGTAAGSLRDALGAIARGVPGATIEALRHTTATLSTVLTDCTGRYQALAERADRHANDAQALSDAFPQPARPP